MVRQARGALPSGYEWAACDLCRADDARVVMDGTRDLAAGAGEAFSIVRCRSCGLRYLNPRPCAEIIGRYYSDTYLPHNPASFPPAGGEGKAVLGRASKPPALRAFVG